eukprot:TRINITY_DN655_c0_g1_i2.p1 TRINITY_DN655_c0_g1~~TRINITY_DN655_c0_g1_i2.p1  ORF type:complete len:156 (-),score=10.58 TRINITY_DN655_c0_g1_i2:205-672(-)
MEAFLRFISPPNEAVPTPPKETRALSSKILNKVYGKYTRREVLDYFHQTGEPPYPIENRIPQEVHEVPVHEPGATYRPSAKNVFTSNGTSSNPRTNWKKGSILEIFSVSQQVWCKGKFKRSLVTSKESGSKFPMSIRTALNAKSRSSGLATNYAL